MKSNRKILGALRIGKISKFDQVKMRSFALKIHFAVKESLGR